MGGRKGRRKERSERRRKERREGRMQGKKAGRQKEIHKERREKNFEKKKVNCKMMHFGYDSCKRDNLKLQLSPRKTLYVGISISKYWQINGYACDLS